jgi:hypothetical protein
MEMTDRCTECNAVWVEGVTCKDCFHQLEYWEFEDLARFGEVHHLMVLSFHLQHPSLYSPEGLAGAREMLIDFLERGVTPEMMRERNERKLDSGQRKFKIIGTLAAHGVYEHPVVWTMTVADVVAGGREAYCANVRAWARSIYESLECSGNLAL